MNNIPVIKCEFAYDGALYRTDERGDISIYTDEGGWSPCHGWDNKPYNIITCRALVIVQAYMRVIEKMGPIHPVDIY